MAPAGSRGSPKGGEARRDCPTRHPLPWRCPRERTRLNLCTAVPKSTVVTAPRVDTATSTEG